ncbi:hypothetical protein E4U16_003525 [Claviceps sp. LM84 group G4]|nr:hypothetical protein E4U16_003525 [Claviceps sp. LM84 group G4]
MSPANTAPPLRRATTVETCGWIDGDPESSYAGINIVHCSVNFGVSLGSGFDFNVELRTPP